MVSADALAQDLYALWSADAFDHLTHRNLFDTRWDEIEIAFSPLSSCLYPPEDPPVNRLERRKQKAYERRYGNHHPLWLSDTFRHKKGFFGALGRAFLKEVQRPKHSNRPTRLLIVNPGKKS